jgi:hypothetical protein
VESKGSEGRLSAVTLPGPSLLFSSCVFCQQSFLVSLTSNFFLRESIQGEKTMATSTLVIRAKPDLATLIQTIRGYKVILDEDLAEVYGVATRRLNEQVKRNSERFPADFVFQLTTEEFKILMSQNATSSSGYGGRRKLPFAFTEHGAVMAANVLKSKRAVRMSLAVVRTFVELRRTFVADRELAKWLRDLERKVEYHDNGIRMLFKAFKQLIASPRRPRRKMGFDV